MNQKEVSDSNMVFLLMKREEERDKKLENNEQIHSQIDYIIPKGSNTLNIKCFISEVAIQFESWVLGYKFVHCFKWLGKITSYAIYFRTWHLY